jgi:hypothetical protein
MVREMSMFDILRDICSFACYKEQGLLLQDLKAAFRSCDYFINKLQNAHNVHISVVLANFTQRLCSRLAALVYGIDHSIQTQLFIWGMGGFSFGDLVVESMHCHACRRVSQLILDSSLPLYHKSRSRFTLLCKETTLQLLDVVSLVTFSL